VIKNMNDTTFVGFYTPTQQNNQECRIQENNGFNLGGGYLINGAPTTRINAQSVNSNISIHVLFKNETRIPVSVYWLNFQGGEQFYANIQPGQSHNQQTYVSHPWVIKNMNDSSFVGFYTPTQQNGQECRIHENNIFTGVNNNNNLSVPEGILDNGRQFFIKSALGNAYLHVLGGQAGNSAKITTWEYVNQANLLWTLTSTTNGFFINSVVDPNFVIHLNGGGSGNGDACTLWDKRTHGHQDNLKIKFERTNDGLWLIKFNNSGKYAHVHGGSTANGTPITQWEFVNQANLKWQIIPK